MPRLSVTTMLQEILFLLTAWPTMISRTSGARRHTTKNDIRVPLNAVSKRKGTVKRAQDASTQRPVRSKSARNKSESAHTSMRDTREGKNQ